MMQGILIVDKPMDWTSFDVVAKLRKASCVVYIVFPIFLLALTLFETI